MILGGVMIGVLILVCVYKTACCQCLPRCSHVFTGKRRGKKLEAKSFHRSVDEINGKIGRLLDHTDGISPVSVNNPTNRQRSLNRVPMLLGGGKHNCIDYKRSP